MQVCDKCNQSFRKQHYFKEHYKIHINIPEQGSDKLYSFVKYKLNDVFDTSFSIRIFYYNDKHF